MALTGYLRGRCSPYCRQLFLRSFLSGRGNCAVHPFERKYCLDTPTKYRRRLVSGGPSWRNMVLRSFAYNRFHSISTGKLNLWLLAVFFREYCTKNTAHGYQRSDPRIATPGDLSGLAWVSVGIRVMVGSGPWRKKYCTSEKSTTNELVAADVRGTDYSLLINEGVYHSSDPHIANRGRFSG